MTHDLAARPTYGNRKIQLTSAALSGAGPYVGRMDKQWFERQRRLTGIKWADVARSIGKKPSGASNILAGNQRMTLEWAQAFAAALQVSVEQVMRQAGELDDAPAGFSEPSAMRFDFGDGDAMPFAQTGQSIAKETAHKQRFSLDRPGVDVWRVGSDAMALQGFMQGDLMLVDAHRSELARAGDVVIAQHVNYQTGSAVTLLRRYEPPVLVAASLDPADRRCPVVDGVNVTLRGVVLHLWRDVLQGSSVIS